MKKIVAMVVALVLAFGVFAALAEGTDVYAGPVEDYLPDEEIELPGVDAPDAAMPSLAGDAAPMPNGDTYAFPEYVPAGDVIMSSAFGTLYSDGTLVVNPGADYYYQPEDWSRYYPDTMAYFLLTVDTSIGNVQYLINPAVSTIVIPEKYPYIARLLDQYPNLETIIIGSEMDYTSSVGLFLTYGTVSKTGSYIASDTDTAALIGEIAAANAAYRSKISYEIEGTTFWVVIAPSDNMAIYGKDWYFKGDKLYAYKWTDLEEAATFYKLAFQEMTCDLDPLLSVVANGSVIYSGESYQDKIESEMHIRCANDHGTESYLSHMVLIQDEHFVVEYLNMSTNEIDDTTNAGSIRVTVTGINGHVGTLTGYLNIEPQALLAGNVALSKQKFTFDGKAVTPEVTVKNNKGKKLVEGEDYTVSYRNNKKAGTATVVVQGIRNYAGKIEKKFKIEKGKQSISLKVKKLTLKAKDLETDDYSFDLGASARTKLTYASSDKKHVQVSSKGKVTVARGTPKGTYVVTVKAKETAAYKAASVKVKITVK